MFQNKNNQTTDGGQTNLSQADDLPIEDLPVHTMKKDLEAIKHPELALEIEAQEAASQSMPINREKLTETQKSSPFLDFSAPKKSAPEEMNSRPESAKSDVLDSRIKFTEPESMPERILPATDVRVITPAPQPEKVAAPQNLPISNNEKPIFDSEKNSAKDKQHPHHINFSKVFAGVIAVLIIAIIAGTGYYFWITRQGTPEVVVTPPITEPEPIPEPIAKFSIDAPNVLTIDMAAATSATIKELLQNTAKDVAQEKASLPIEFIVTGTDGKPVIFKDFTKILGITFSPALTANLSDAFSLFIYNDNAVTRGGIAIESKDPIKLKGLLTLEEKTLVKSIAESIVPAFLASNPAFTAKAFTDSDHKGTAIRYINITSPEDWSVDYAIYQNKLVIGTTKMTLRAIVDKTAPIVDGVVQPIKN
ncbi:MAG: hypothetical protein WC608_03490 [Parcubacteria group bacterium]